MEIRYTKAALKALVKMPTNQHGAMDPFENPTV
jgi:hypothetical protein